MENNVESHALYSDEDVVGNMHFTPKQAPAFGGQSIFISCEGSSSPLNKDGVHYLIFEGSKMRHLTSARLINPFTLQAVIPSHDVEETVSLSVWCTQDKKSVTLCRGMFTFTLDTTTLFAQSLVMNSTNSSALKQLEVMYGTLFCGTTDERMVLDTRILTEFEKLHLPDTWSLCEENDWTLLHLCAKHSLEKLARHLIGERGASKALKRIDENGKKPVDIAMENTNITLIELFSRPPLEKSKRESESINMKPIVKRHQLGTTTISSNLENSRTIEQDAQLLEDLQNLAVESAKHQEASNNNEKPGDTHSHPLAHSLQKLREINLEIQRLRCMNQIDDNQHDVLLHDRRARSFSCPDSFNDFKKERNQGYTRYSLSLTSCDEEEITISESLKNSNTDQEKKSLKITSSFDSQLDEMKKNKNETTRSADATENVMNKHKLPEDTLCLEIEGKVDSIASDLTSVQTASENSQKIVNMKCDDQVSLEMKDEDNMVSSENMDRLGSVKTEETKENIQDNVTDDPVYEVENTDYDIDEEREIETKNDGRVAQDDEIDTTDEKYSKETPTSKERNLSIEKDQDELSNFKEDSDKVMNRGNVSNENEIFVTTENVQKHKNDEETKNRGPILSTGVENETSLLCDGIKEPSVTDDRTREDIVEDSDFEMLNSYDHVKLTVDNEQEKKTSERTSETYSDFDCSRNKDAVKDNEKNDNNSKISSLEDNVGEITELKDDGAVALKMMPDNTEESGEISITDHENEISVVEDGLYKSVSQTEYRSVEETDNKEGATEITSDCDNQVMTEESLGESSVEGVDDIDAAIDLDDIEIQDTTVEVGQPDTPSNAVTHSIASNKEATEKIGEEVEPELLTDIPTQNSSDGLQNNDLCDGSENDSSDVSKQNYDQQDFSARSNNSIVQEVRPLAAVTEETEEELLELDGKNDGDFQKYGKSHSLEEIKKIKQLEQRMHRSAEQVYIPREVAVLRRGILKKERPLSDNYENIKMVEREYRSNRLSKRSDSDESLTSLDKRKSKSLDALSIDEEDTKTPSLTSSQLSIHGSTESLPSIDVIDSRGMFLYRSKSVGPAAGIQRASLNDICFAVRDDNEGSVKLNKKRRSRFSFKRKSKSTTALDKRDPELTDEERRRTIIGGVSTEKLLAARKSCEFETNRRRVHPEKNRYNNRDSGIDSTCDLNLEDIIISTPTDQKDSSYMRTNSDGLANIFNQQKDRNRTSSDFSGDSRDTEDEVDADTDEGTSSEIAEKVRKSSICAEEKKKEKKFGILRSKTKKDKKHSKDKDTVDAKLAKKSHKDSKSSFLGKKPSFRQGQKTSLSSNTLSVESKMFARSSSAGKTGTNPKHSSSSDNLRGSGRGLKISPSSVRKTNHEVDGVPDSDSSSSNLNTLAEYKRRGSATVFGLLSPMQCIPESSVSSNLNISTHSLDSLSLEDLAEAVADAPYQVDDWSQYDSDLEIKNEPETWSNLVERKVQRKLHAKDIKRQDVIYELIFTERNYVRTLKIVSRIYCVGLKRELGLDSQTIEDLFPRVDDLLEINETFCKRMKKRQEESNNNVIEDIGDILVDQFSGANGEFMKEVYGYFCSRHLQAVALYKELMKTDKKFAVFIKKCMLNARVRRLSIPECITLATQRLTKYPLLFEAILKATKESKSDYENIKKALKKVKEVLQAVDDYVRKHEKEQELIDLRKRFDSRGEVQYKNGQTFKNSKLLSKRSILIHEGTLTWKGKAKSIETKAVLLADKIFFLQEKDQRLSLLSLDNKAPVIYLRSLIVREVATDMKALYLVNNEGPEMYELVCSSTKNKMQWIKLIMDAIKNKPDDEDENLSDLEEEMRKEEETRIARLKEIIEHLQATDNQVSNLIMDKNRLVIEMRELIDRMVPSKDGKSSNLDLKATDVLEGRETLERAIAEAGSLTTLLCGGEIEIQPQLSLHSTAQGLTTAPKRAETFGGFDRNSKSLMPPPQVSRASSLKQENRLSVAGKIQGTFEIDHGGKDPKERIRKTSQGLMSVITRNKPMGSAEDLSSASSSNSSLPQIHNSSAQKLLAVTQLKEYLTSLMDVTNKQDIELASIRVELHQSRSEINKLRTERQSIEERLIQQQKEHERQLNRQKESYAKLEREFKRTVEKFNKQIEEHKFQYQLMKDKYTELHQYVYSMQNSSKSKQNSLSLSSIRQKHHTLQEQETSNSKRHTTHEDYDAHDVIFF